ncbi:MAG: TM0996/MTH895 family glutaredoxin-like protein [bacterium]|jgi:small redox-active disulfide protein 2
MKVEIFGTGCAKCIELENRTRSVLRNLGVEADFSKVTDLNKIIAAGVMMTPGLAIDGKLVLSGKLPTMPELTSIITTRLSQSETGSGA